MNRKKHASDQNKYKRVRKNCKKKKKKNSEKHKNIISKSYANDLNYVFSTFLYLLSLCF